MTKFRYLAIALLAFASTAMAQVTRLPSSNTPQDTAPTKLQVDSAEAIRRGDMVVVAGEGARSGYEEAAIRATAPPPDDNHMWHITLFKQAGCKPCEQLRSHFKTQEELRVLVEAPQGGFAWAHYVVIDINDATQQHRISKYKLKGTPTVVIQPPRNGMWGDPADVVCQITGYDGDPKKYKSTLMEKVRHYASVQSQQGYPKQPTRADIAAGARAEDAALPVAAGATQYGGPFQPPAVDPFNPNVPQPAVYPPTPTPTPNPNGGVTIPVPGLQTFAGMGVVLLVALVALRGFEMYAKRTANPIDDQIATFAIEIVQALRNGGGQTETPPLIQAVAKRRAARKKTPGVQVQLPVS